MQEKDIHVKILDDQWGVVFQSKDEKESEEFSVKMPSKEDAIRYARACEQRTGNKVVLPE